MPEFSFQNISIYAHVIFEMFSIDRYKFAIEKPKNSTPNLRFICLLFSADPFIVCTSLCKLEALETPSYFVFKKIYRNSIFKTFVFKIENIICGEFIVVLKEFIIFITSSKTLNAIICMTALCGCYGYHYD